MNKRASHRIVIAVLSLWLLSMACSALSPVKSSNASSPTGSILYGSDESGNFEIYHMNIKSREKVKLTDNTSDEVNPFYFSQGRLGFVSDKSGKWQIYTMNLDGSDQKIWKKDAGHNLLTPSMSPDGAQIAYVAKMNDNDLHVYLSNSDGSQEQELLSEVTGDPFWSPDGKKLAFATMEDGDWEIAVMDMVTEEVTYLTKNTSYDGRPRWSPDGTKILFDSDRDGDWEIYVMDADGQNVRAITENSSGDWGANWSPDGQWIVYSSSRDGDDEIYITGIDGTHQLKLTDNKAQDQFAIWVP